MKCPDYDKELESRMLTDGWWHSENCHQEFKDAEWLDYLEKQKEEEKF